MSKSTTEEIVGLLWFILATQTPSGLVRTAAIGLGLFAMVCSILYAVQNK